jgi:serine/threonine protein kinase
MSLAAASWYAPLSLAPPILIALVVRGCDLAVRRCLTYGERISGVTGGRKTGEYRDTIHQPWQWLKMSDWAAETHVAGRYRLDRLLGQGGMGQVHVAHDTLLERNVAIKTLGDESTRDPVARARLRREALAAAALDHPFICKVFEVGEHDGRDFIVMEYVEGRTLDAVIDDRSITPRQLVEIAHELAQALDEAHRRGIVHRDLSRRTSW